MNLPGQSITEALHTTTLYVYIYIYIEEGDEPPSQSITEATLKLQLLHNMKRPTKWSGHVKMIDSPENFYI